MTPKFEPNKYYWISKIDGSDKCLVYCFINPDYLDGTHLCLGFNFIDGGMYIPLEDIEEELIIKELKEVQNENL